MSSQASARDLRRLLTVIATSLLLVLATFALIDRSAQAAGTGTVSGVVRASDNVVIEGNEVQIYSYDGDDEEYVARTETNEQGQYSLTVPVGSYRVYVWGGNNDLNTFHPSTTSRASAGKVVVGEGANVTANVKRVQGATIGGKVTIAGGAGVADSSVALYDMADCADVGPEDCFPYISMETQGDGTYAFEGLRPGTYRVGFEPQTYQPEFYKDVRTLGAASDITVALGTTRNDINVQLDPGATISGVVKDNHGAPMADAYVQVSLGNFIRSVKTASNGSYSLTGLPAGNLAFYVQDEDGLYTQVRGTIATSGTQSYTRNAELTKLTIITGTITDHAGTPVTDAYLSVYKKNASTGEFEDYEFRSQSIIGGDNSHVDDNGVYILPVEQGTYRFRAAAYDDNGVIDSPTFFGNVGTLAAATDIVVPSLEQTISGKNVTLQKPASLGGTVAVPAGFEGIVPIEILDSSGDVVEYTEVDSETTNYQVNGLSAGSYKVQFGRASGLTGVAGQYYNNVAEGGGLGSATPIALNAGQTKSDVNATMKAGASLTGTVKRGNGAAAAGCRVQVFSANDDLSGRSAFTGADGKFTITGISAGTYNVAVNVSNGGSDDNEFECMGLPVSGPLPTPGYYSAENGTLSPTATNLRTVQLGASGTTALPVTLQFPGSAPQTIVSSGTPTISGTPKVGSTLTAGGVTWTPSDVAVAYQWKSGGANVGSNQSTYVPTAADIGKTITVQLTASKTGYTTKVLQSGATSAVVTNVTPLANTKAPSVSGTLQVGKVLQAGGGNWSGAPTGYAYQWSRNGSPISGATKQKYTAVAADAGKKLSVKVTASKSGTASVSASSAQTAAVAKGVLALSGKASVTGTVKVGKKLKAKAQTCKPGATITYQWLRSGKAITGAAAKKASYKLKAADQGKKVSVKITYKRAGYATVVKTVKVKKKVA